jgi:hypothetical protein
MAIRNLDQVLTSNNFSVWLDRTNSIINSLENVVTMGGTEQNNDALTGVNLTGPLITQDTAIGIQTSKITPPAGINALDLDFDTVDIKQQLRISTASTGKNDTIVFYNGTDFDDPLTKTYFMGPLDGHEEFEINAINMVAQAATSKLRIKRPDANTGLMGIVTGDHIVIDDDILPASITANCDTATALQTSLTVQFGGQTADQVPVDVGGNLVGSISFDGSEGTVYSAITVDDSIFDAGVESFAVAASGGLVTTATSTAADVIIDHYTPAAGDKDDNASVNNTTTTAIQDLNIDKFGHLIGSSSVNLNNYFLKKNPNSNTSRSVLNGNGFVVDIGTKISFTKQYTTGSTASDVNTEASISCGLHNLVINAGSDATPASGSGYSNVIMKGDNVYIQNQTGTSKFRFANSSGNFIATGDITAYGSTSDISLKENIEPIENALDKVSEIGGYTFNYIDTPEKGRVPGVIAQELEKVLPEAVYETDEGYKAVRYDNTIALLIEAIKELKQEVDSLKNK